MARRSYATGALAAVLAAALAVVWGRGGSVPDAPTLARLAATNYRTLTQSESRMLLR